MRTGEGCHGTGGTHLAGTVLGAGVSPRRHESHGSESLKAWGQKANEWSPWGQRPEILFA